MSSATQDAQVAKQAKEQIKHNADVLAGKKKPLDRPATDITTRTATAKEVVNTATVHKFPAQPAHGATEKAPHTKRAIQQHKVEDKLEAAKKALDDATAATKAKNLSKDPKNPERLAAFTAKAKAEKDLIAARNATAKTKPVAKTPPVKTPRVTVNQNIKPGKTIYPADKATWGRYMIQTALASKTTEEAKALHAKSAEKAGYPASKPLDFKWMHDKGYIVLS